MIINGYFTLYDLESDDGWSELYNLNDILNTDVSNIESILNVYRTLGMHVLIISYLTLKVILAMAKINIYIRMTTINLIRYYGN